MSLELESLKKAVNSLDSLLNKTNNKKYMETLDNVTQKGLKSGVIQNFEFTYELCWKFMKRWLKINLGRVYVDGISIRELFRISSENLLIENVDK